MTLTLELTESSGGTPGTASQHVFGEAGGTIGRANSNSWVLPHNKVSGTHAVITFRNGVFYLEDTSRNGVFVNSPDNRLVRNRPYALRSGDRLLIEPYEIGIWIDGEVAAPRAQVPDPFAQDDPFRPPARRREPSLAGGADAILPEPPVGGVVDPLEFFDPIGGPPPRPRPELPVDIGLGQHYRPPEILSPLPPPAPAPPPAAGIPAGYNPLADDLFVEPIAPPPTPGPVRPRPGSDSGIFRRKPREGSDSPRIPADANPPTAPVSAEPASVAPPEPPPAMSARDLEQEVTGPMMPAAPVLPSRPLPRPAPSGAGAPPQAAPPARPPIAPAPVVPPADVPFAAPPSSPAPPVVTPREAAAPVNQPPKVATVRESAAAVSRPESDLLALLAGAGVPDAVVTPELTRNLGEILRVVVSGLMDVLQSRQRIKEEFRMQQTLFRPADNNPLKFSVNVEDALHNLLVKRNPAYLRPVDAFADAFDDLRDHQLAMLAGMRVAFDAMLGEFDPDRLQEQFDTQLGKGSLIPVKMRYWDLLRARRAELVKDPEEAFERLFGEVFRRAYEQQFRQLKAQRRGRAANSDPERP